MESFQFSIVGLLHFAHGIILVLDKGTVSEKQERTTGNRSIMKHSVTPGGQNEGHGGWVCAYVCVCACLSKPKPPSAAVPEEALHRVLAVPSLR